MRNYFCFNRILAGVIALLLLATVFFACSKTTNDSAPNNPSDIAIIGAGADQAIVSNYYEDMFVLAMRAANVASLADPGSSNSGVVTNDCIAHFTLDDYTPNQFPKTITLDFGTGCADNDGRIRSGKLTIQLTGYAYYPGSTITVKPVGYSVDTVSVLGDYTFTNKSDNNVYKYTGIVTNGAIQLDSVAVTYNSKRSITMIDGMQTLYDVSDDVFSFAGVDTLTYVGGSKAVISIGDSTALVRAFSCPWIGKGRAQITMSTLSATVDFGNGICDDSVAINIGDKIKYISLPK